MPIKVTMPALSPTMTEGTLANWLKSEGDTVEAGDVIAEIETDKATMEVEAVDEGVLGKILVQAGTEGVPVNEVIAVLLEDGEDKARLMRFWPMIIRARPKKMSSRAKPRVLLRWLKKKILRLQSLLLLPLRMTRGAELRPLL